MTNRSPRDPLHDRMASAAEKRARPFANVGELSGLIDELARARVVMLGECSHGTREFYEWRAAITRELVVRHGFRFVAVEGDWPDCARLDRYIRSGDGGSARAVQEGIRRWPTWMWANEEVIGFAEWLRRHNADLGEEERVGFHGLDLYSFFESVDAVLERLQALDPILARRARVAYGCFDPFRRDELAYARSLLSLDAGCENEVNRTLRELLQVRLDGLRDREQALFDARMNARVARNAELYYRTMARADEESWNVRDNHMMETLDTLLQRYGHETKAIVWAHNTHVGDYRATDMLRAGMVNLGGLAREQLGEDTVALVGFGTHRGEVVASPSWDGPVEILPVPPALRESHDGILHEISAASRHTQLYLRFEDEDRTGPLAEIRGQRAIGVVYDPRHERWGNYVPTSLSRRYDAYLFFDETRALRPLSLGFDHQEIPETWPMGS